jgi:hypothetical protein
MAEEDARIRLQQIRQDPAVMERIRSIREITENLDRIPYSGVLSVPRDNVNSISRDTFIQDEEVIVILEDTHRYIFKRGPLETWFKTLRNQGQLLANPLTQNPILNMNSLQRYTVNLLANGGKRGHKKKRDAATKKSTLKK